MIGIIDYDAGNLRSVEKALQYLGKETIVTRDPEQIRKADKVILPGVGAFGDAMKKLQEYHLDTNHHVNNGQYVRMATAYLPETFVIRELRVEYRSQAMLGDTIRPVRYEMPDGYLVALQDSAGKAYCVVRFMG